MTASLKTHTLGCKVNQYETQFVREGLHSIGFRDADAEETADLCIVNTCTVTSEGDSKSRQVIRRLNRENPDARIIVMGCYATRAPGEIAALPGVADVVTDKRELPDLLARFGVVDIPNGISGLNNRHRAYIKVQDGCLLSCSYCIIPQVRPQMYSREPESILQEVERLVKNGFREVILTGIHLGHYGVDFNRGRPKREWIRLAQLVERICELPGDFRVRLSSIEATEVTGDLLDVMVARPGRVCPHLHVCLQSGSDAVLRRMRRRWTVKRIVDRCQRIRELLDRPALTTDVIVGFPGETDDDFVQTLDVCRQIGFSKIHAFPFSARKGTAAAEMAEQLSRQEKRRRLQKLVEVERQLQQDYRQSLLGRELQVMVESQESNVARGTSCRYLPVSFSAPGHDSLQGRLVRVQTDAIQTGGDDAPVLTGNVLP